MNLFEEKQRFHQWWIWALLLLPPAAIGVGLGVEYNSSSGISTDSVWGLAILLLISLALLFVFLETRISPEGISARLFPFHLKFRMYPWAELESIQVRKYNPIGEFGGWGLRSWGGKKGNAWNISGNKGIQLKFKSGRELLIGTQKPKEVEGYLLELSRAHPHLNIPVIKGKW
jgi:hypothetical protein